MQHVLNSKGYSLAEAVIQLSVLLLFSQLIITYYAWFHKVEQHFRPEAIEWELFSMEMTSELSIVDWIEVQENSTGIRFAQDGTEYDIECSAGSIRKQKARLGHEPMLTGIKLCKLDIVGNKVSVAVVFQDGRGVERSYEFLASSK